jgi:hypothetical protein
MFVVMSNREYEKLDWQVASDVSSTSIDMAILMRTSANAMTIVRILSISAWEIGVNWSLANEKRHPDQW